MTSTSSSSTSKVGEVNINKNDALSTTSDLVFIGDGTNGRDAGNLGLVEGKSLENGVAYRFTVDVTAGVSSAVLTVEKVER